jgi:hypothetical protein
MTMSRPATSWSVLKPRKVTTGLAHMNHFDKICPKLLVFTSGAIAAAIVMIANNLWTGILIAHLAWYFARQCADAVFDFIYVQTAFVNNFLNRLQKR